MRGSGFVWLHRNLEAIEIGRNVLHGQYDYFPEIPQFTHKLQMESAIDEEGWRRSTMASNMFTIQRLRKDPDLNHGLLRTNDRTPWHLSFHRFQVPLYLFGVYPTMLYRFNGQNLGFAQEYRANTFFHRQCRLRAGRYRGAPGAIAAAASPLDWPVLFRNICSFRRWQRRPAIRR